MQSGMAKSDNNTVFARPNLKAFLLGAVLLLVVQHLISSAHSQGPSATRPLPVNARELSEADMEELMRKANENPSYQNYLRLSRCYEQRGEFRKALRFLRRAETIGSSDDAHQ